QRVSLGRNDLLIRTFPNTWINIDKLIFSPWQEWQGKLSLALTSDIQ
ncbi:hypothetical protein, partial [Shigella sonnei]